MGNLHDWCISRQIWFGHRIPVWYCVNKVKSQPRKLSEQNSKSLMCGEIIVSISKPKKCLKCGGTKFKQDEDTLDTWFSAGLWTFSTLGWPKKTKDFVRFHPTSVMETGYDILFFWVARMILMSTYLVGQVPFKTVYLHGLVRDKLGRKMSKSLGNGIDPLDMIKKYGADAVRLSLIIGTTPGNDVRLYEEKIAGYRNYVNKIWNIARFVLSTKQIVNSNLKSQISKPQLKTQNLTAADHWILYEFGELLKRVNRNMEHFRFSAVGEDLYEFMWHKFADIYIEAAKIEKKAHQQEILEYVLKTCLVMLHPFIPFVTEKIWGLLQEEANGNADMSKQRFLITTPWIERGEVPFSKTQARAFIKARETHKRQSLTSKERQDIEKYISALESRLANKQFFKNAPKEVIEKEKERLRQAHIKLR